VKIRAVIYDLDGTLLNSGKRGFDRLGMLARQNNIDFSQSVQKCLKEFWGLPPTELISTGLGVTKEIAEKIHKQWIEWDKKDPIPLVGGVVEMLEKNIQKGIFNFVFTSRHTESALDILKRYNIISFFEDAIGIEGGAFVPMSEFRKPNPHSLDNLLQFINENYGISRNGIAYVGDEIFDIQCGMGAKLETYGVLSGLKTKEELIAVGACAGNIFLTVAHIAF
jgi:phosphoglycolate phosphatase-like HAD superfamily hydrolase